MTDSNGAFQIWKRQLSNKSDKTRRDYLKNFERFLSWSNTTSDKLREMKFSEENQREPWLRTEVENLVRQYIGHMKKKGYAGATIHARVAAVRSFFKAQNLPLHLNKDDQPHIGNPRATGTPTRKELRVIVDCADSLRDRAVILFLKDTGLRASDVSPLLWKDLREVEPEFWAFKTETVKRSVVARGFIGVETIETLERYKRQRINGSKHVKPEINIQDHPLFSPLPESGHFNGGQNRLTASAIGHVVRFAIVTAGYEGRFSAHSLRRYWEQTVRADREAYVKQLNGRKLNVTERAYYWRTEAQLLELYKQNYNNLRVLESVIDSKDIEAIANGRVKAEIGRRDTEIAKLWAAVQDQAEFMKRQDKLLRETHAALLNTQQIATEFKSIAEKYQSLADNFLKKDEELTPERRGRKSKKKRKSKP